MPSVDPFAPTRLGPVALRNRIIKAATFEGVMPEALVTPELTEYHRAVAAGGAGMSTVAYLAVAPEGRTHAECIWLRPEAVPGLRRLTDAIHAEGAAAAAQIGHAGPVANSRSNKAAVAGSEQAVQPTGHAGHPLRHRRRHRPHHQRLRPGRPPRRRQRLRRHRDPPRPQLPAQRLPQPQPQQAHRLLGRLPRQPGPVRSPSRAGGSGPRSATSWPSPPRST